MAKKKEVTEITLDPINLKVLEVDIVGKTPLLMDKFPEEEKQKILEKQTGQAQGNKKMIRDTKKEVEEAIHKTSKGKIGFPAFGFKAGMMESTSFVGDKMFSKKLVSGAVKILNVDDGLVLIKWKKRDVLKHSIECNTKFSPQFHDWSTKLRLEYDANNIAAKDIVTLINYAGFYIGIGAWRPKAKGGSGEYGMYEVRLKRK